MLTQTHVDRTALVARHADAHEDRYLLVTPERPVWVDDPGAATAFATLREAMRMVVHLPAGLHAFGVPRRTELAAAAH